MIAAGEAQVAGFGGGAAVADTGWLRATLKAPVDVQDRAYRAFANPVDPDDGRWLNDGAFAVHFVKSLGQRRTCSAQIKTLSMGREPHVLDPRKVARYQDQMAASDHYNYDGAAEWPGLIRMLDKRDPDYAT